MPKKNANSIDQFNPEEKKEVTKLQKPREKKEQYQGSRWSSLLVLMLLVAIGFILSITSNH